MRGIHWAPAVLLTLGAMLTLGVVPQRSLTLRKPLAATVPQTIGGYESRDVQLSRGEVRVAGVTNYLYRNFEAPGEPDSWFSVYVGYYDRQTQGKTIHSPKNCLPGGGWEALQSSTAGIPVPGGTVTVNRYLLQKGSEYALVLYWYQGRGRVQANEYAVKWNLLRDAAFRQRSEEALVRIVVPISESPETAFELAKEAAMMIIPALTAALPE